MIFEASLEPGRSGYASNLTTASNVGLPRGNLTCIGNEVTRYA